MTFDDGIMKIYSMTDSAASGMKPVPQLAPDPEEHFFSYGTVGVTRYYAALQAERQVHDVIDIPDWHDIRTDDQIAVNEAGEQFRILQAQKTYDDDHLKITRISLERIGDSYAVMSGTGEGSASDGDE